MKGWRAFGVRRSAFSTLRHRKKTLFSVCPCQSALCASRFCFIDNIAPFTHKTLEGAYHVNSGN